MFAGVGANTPTSSTRATLRGGAMFRPAAHSGETTRLNPTTMSTIEVTSLLEAAAILRPRRRAPTATRHLLRARPAHRARRPPPARPPPPRAAAGGAPPPPTTPPPPPPPPPPPAGARRGEVPAAGQRSARAIRTR